MQLHASPHSQCALQSWTQVLRSASGVLRRSRGGDSPAPVVRRHRYDDCDASSDSAPATPSPRRSPEERFARAAGADFDGPELLQTESPAKLGRCDAVMHRLFVNNGWSSSSGQHVALCDARTRPELDMSCAAPVEYSRLVSVE